ncbi:MAG: F-box protein [Candidatus Melainabacteria bacterium]|nr:F-box protein [Candidatus Melainabacteria bacterium]
MAIKTNQSINESLPSDCIVHAFRFLPLKDLAVAARVCKGWNDLTTHNLLWRDIVKRTFGELKEINEQSWVTHVDLAKYGLKVDGAEQIDYRGACKQLKRLSSDVKDNAGLTEVTFPQGLTINKLLQIVRDPKVRNKTGCSLIWDNIIKQLGDVPIEKSYKGIFTNSILKNSLNKAGAKHQQMVVSFECEKPKVIELMVLCLLTNLLSKSSPPTCLYSDSFSSCDETIEGLQLMAGTYSQKGLAVTFSPKGFSLSGVGAIYKRTVPSRSTTLEARTRAKKP